MTPSVPAPRTEMRFGDFRLVLGERRVERDGVTVAIGGRALDILTVLLLRAGQVVSKADLCEAAWPGMQVEEGSLRFHIASLRRALGDKEGAAPLVSTVAGRGYCFTGKVSRSGASEGGMAAPAKISSPALPGRRPAFGIADASAKAAEAVIASRFVTLVGPPGIGKTTLALDLAHRLSPSFSGGAAFVDLGSVSSAQLVPNAIATAIGRLVSADRPTEALFAILERQEMLLVLDGCEHVIDAVAEIAEDLFFRLPGLSIVATSRESLRIDGERVYRLGPLPSPAVDAPLSPNDAMTYPAIELFVERMRSGRLGYEPSDWDIRSIAGICRRLDGIPLALELAASRAASHGLRETETLIEGRLRLLWRGWRTAPARHQTLSAALDWSYDLLSRIEQRMLRCVSVFVGNFSIEEAHVVAGREAETADEVSQTLADLVSKSLLVLDEAEGTARYHLLDTMRVYAGAKLCATLEAKTVIRNHAALYCDTLAADGPVDAFYSRPAPGPRENLLANVRAALQWSFATGEDDDLAVSMVAAAAPLYLGQSLASECIEWIDRALRSIGNRAGSVVEASLQAARGLACMAVGGNAMEAERAFRRGLAIACDHDDPYNRFRFLGGLHAVLLRSGDFAGALAIAREGRVAAERFGDPAAVSMAEAMLSVAHHFAGDHEAAREHGRAAESEVSTALTPTNMQLGIDLRSRIKAAITRDLWIRGHSLSAEEAAWAAVHETAELGHPLAHATSMVFNASVFFWQRDLPAAEEIVRRLSDHAQRHLLPAYSAVGLGMEGMLDLGHGDYEGASRKLREALDTLETLHFQVVTPWFMGAFAECRTALGQRDEGLAIVEEALLLVIRNGDRANLPDLLRIKGELLASHPSDRRAAVMALREALAWSTAQGAPAWNLRAAISLARLHRDDGRAEEAALVLRKAMADFEQVEESMDYSIASEMLEELRPISRSC